MKLISLFSMIALAAIVLSSGCNSAAPEEGVTGEMRFVEISSGSFEMGAPEGEEWSTAKERPVHTVTLDYSFEIMAIEVTQGVWEEVMGSNPATGEFVGANYPVFNVSWVDCQEFCDQLNQLDPEHSYRLPSESEWEYCCRAETESLFFWGTLWYNGSYYAWYGGSQPHPVGELRINDWALFDIAGNLYEWCQDSYHPSYQGAPSDGSAWIDGTAGDRMIRGGSWGEDPQACRSAFREPVTETTASEKIGFRLVRTSN